MHEMLYQYESEYLFDSTKFETALFISPPHHTNMESAK